MKKAISIAALFLLLTVCLNVTAVAAPPTEIQPMWENTSLVTGTMVFNGPDGTTGMTEMRVIGKVGVTRIEGTVTIYQVVGDTLIFIKNDGNTVNTRSCYIETAFPAEHGGEYRADFRFVVYKAGVGEVIERTITKTCP